MGEVRLKYNWRSNYRHGFKTNSHEYNRMKYACIKYTISQQEYCENKEKYDKGIKNRQHTKHNLHKNDLEYFKMMHTIKKYGITVREYWANKEKYPTNGKGPIRTRHLSFEVGTKEYSKSLDLYKSYGIDLSQYNKMYESQDGKCLICNSYETRKLDENTLCKLSVDHCHKTGKIRGLLCNKCNTALGGFKDSIEILESAIKYLKR